MRRCVVTECWFSGEKARACSHILDVWPLLFKGQFGAQNEWQTTENSPKCMARNGNEQ
jgi:hypothetical protein